MKVSGQFHLLSQQLLDRRVGETLEMVWHGGKQMYKEVPKTDVLPHLVHKRLVAWPVVCTELLKELCWFLRSILY